MDDESLNTEQLWGESTDLDQEFPNSRKKDILNNREQDVIINSIEPILFKTSFYNGDNGNCSYRRECDVMVLDDVMRRTCKLLKHKNDMKEMFERSKSQHDFLNVDKLRNDIPRILNVAARKDESIQLFKHESSNFVNGVFAQPPPNITSESALMALRSSVSTILSFIGFSTTTMLPLQLLTEVAEDYIRRMAKLLHVNVEKELLDRDTGFTDVLDRTCHEMGLGSVRNLAHYFKEETLVMNRKMIKECKEELVVYEEAIKKLREEKRQTSELSFVEMDDEDQVIPELHLTSISGSDMSSEPFEAGLQMLQTLERHRVTNMDVSSQVSCSSSSTIASLAPVKSEFEDVKPFKRRRK